jgi:acetyltransferase-like isoleucine patch superfamily enzyme
MVYYNGPTRPSAALGELLPGLRRRPRPIAHAAKPLHRRAQPVSTEDPPALLLRLYRSFAARLHGNRLSPLADLKRPRALRLGRRIKVHAHATLDASGGGGIELGDGVTVNRYAMIQGGKGGVRFGAGSEINNYSVVNGTGGVSIGADVLIGPHVQLISYQHNFADRTRPIKTQGLAAAPIVIEDDVWIGAGAIVLAGVTIGRGSVVGAGAVVTHSCPPNSLLLGVPARVVRQR